MLMTAYQILVVGDDGVTVLATTDTATEALAKFKGALDDFRRVWVTNETGADLLVAELIARSLGEQGRKG